MCDEKISEKIEKKYFEMNLNFAEFGFVESMRELAGMYLKGFGGFFEPTTNIIK